MSEIIAAFFILTIPFLISTVCITAPLSFKASDAKLELKEDNSGGAVVFERYKPSYSRFTDDLEKDAVTLEWKQFLSFYNIAPENYECTPNRIYYKGQRVIINYKYYHGKYLPWIKEKYIREYKKIKLEVE